MDTLPFGQARKKYSLAGVGPCHSQEGAVVLTGSKILTPSQVEAWALEFDLLLGDPAGLQTFAEFLKKEFSHENIYFWCACEKFRRVGAPGADEIIERHLAPGAWEPVNVDAAARTSAQEIEVGTGEEKELFLASQKQIYNLMKFDSYGRFLKSDLYQACLEAENKGRRLPFTGEDMDQELAIEGMKTRVVVEPRTRRRSFLPWAARREARGGRLLSRSSEALDSDASSCSSSTKAGQVGSEVASRLTPSVSELNLRKRSDDVPTTGVSAFCRVTLPDGAVNVVNVTEGETVMSCMEKLLQRRGFAPSNFQVLEQESRLPLDLTRDSSKLAGREVRIVQTRQEDEEEDRDQGAKSSSISSSLRDGSKLTLASEQKLGGRELGELGNK